MYYLNEQFCKNAEVSNPSLKYHWYGMNSTSNFGCMTYLYKKYGCPATYQEFYDQYTTDITGNDVKTYGRDERYIYTKATELKQKSAIPADIEVFYDYIIKKLIVDTLDGSKKELELKEYLVSNGYNIIEPTYEEDTKLGIDCFVIKDGKLVAIAQIKPHTFFLGDRNKTLINDRILALEKEKKCNQIYKVPVGYFIYDKNTGNWITKNNGGIAHKLTNLINSDGTTKHII